jgi:signal transduction histidine kinase
MALADRRQDDIAVALSASLDPERVLHEVVQHARHVLPFERLTIGLLDDESGEVRKVHEEGGDDAPADDKRLHEDWRRALERGEPITGGRRGAKSVTVPLTGTEIAGAITVVPEQSGSDEEIAEASRTLTALASHAALALERARRVQRTVRQQRLEAIGEVAAGIAHELRNPLFGISSAAQLLRYRAREDPVLERNVGRILREAERLNAMVADLLEYARPGTAAMAPGDPDLIWDEVLEGHRGLLESRGLSITRAKPVHAARCQLSHERLAQALANLLVNAADAAPPGTTLTLTSRLLPNRAWRCTLHNDGTPIPPEVLPRAFEIFVSTKPGSTGLGLALARRIMDEHNGHITLESTADRGTTVTLTLPAK